MWRRRQPRIQDTQRASARPRVSVLVEGQIWETHMYTHTHAPDRPGFESEQGSCIPEALPSSGELGNRGGVWTLVQSGLSGGEAWS